MDFQVVWTDPALVDLRGIVAYIAQNNSEAAERIGNDIVDHVDTLRTFPFIGPKFPRSSRSALHREIVCGNYRIFYRVFEEWKRVEILAIWHGARGEPDLN